MRQQEGIHDDNQHVQLHCCDYEEVDHEGASHEEVDHDHEEVFDEEDGRRCFAVCFSGSITDSYSLTVRFAAVRRLA